MANGKNKSFKITVDGKEYTFNFHKTDVEAEELACETRCPLNGICDKLRDPRHPDDGEYSFNDFCLCTGDKGRDEADVINDDTLDGYMPVIEDVLKFAEGTNTEIYQEIIKANPYVKISDLIDNVCSEDGFGCTMYDKEHSRCTSKNGMCILKKLFKV